MSVLYCLFRHIDYAGYTFDPLILIIDFMTVGSGLCGHCVDWPVNYFHGHNQIHVQNRKTEWKCNMIFEICINYSSGHYQCKKNISICNFYCSTLVMTAGQWYILQNHIAFSMRSSHILYRIWLWPRESHWPAGQHSDRREKAFSRRGLGRRLTFYTLNQQLVSTTPTRSWLFALWNWYTLHDNFQQSSKKYRLSLFDLKELWALKLWEIGFCMENIIHEISALQITESNTEACTFIMGSDERVLYRIYQLYRAKSQTVLVRYH